MTLTCLPVDISFILLSKIIFSFLIELSRSIFGTVMSELLQNFDFPSLTLLVEIACSVLIRLQLLLHFYIITLNDALLLLHFVLPVDFLKTNLVRLVGPRHQRNVTQLNHSVDLLDLFNSTKNVVLVLLQLRVHICV